MNPVRKSDKYSQLAGLSKHFLIGMKNIKIIAILIVSFVVFTATFFALAENKNSNTIFLDSDQDGLTNQEEKMIGTNPEKADTDSDGYSDGKEVESGYNPLKAAPGDKIIPASLSSELSSIGSNSDQESSQVNSQNSSLDLTSTDFLNQLAGNEALSSEALTDLSSDPTNPNLTNEMIGQLMQLTKEKADTSSSFAENPTFTAEDYSQIAQGALETVNIENKLPEISDSEIKILPEIKGKNLSADELKEKQKEEIEKYLAQVAFILASNSPFPVENTSDLQGNLATESTNLIQALAAGDQSKIEAYSEKAQSGIDQIKKIEVPYILKDTHKSILQLALYTLSLKEDLFLSTTDPVKSLAAASSLQAVAESATKIQGDLSQILSDYGIDEISLP